MNVAVWRPDCNQETAVAAKPKIYVPTLYFSEGLPYTIVNSMSVLFFKTLAMSNADIGIYTTALSVPWTFKLFWAPLVDLHATRRDWIIGTQIALAVMSALITAAVFIPDGKWFLLLLFAVMAFASSFQDVAVDGYYLDVLNKDQQAFYVGVRNSAYKIAWLFGSGALVYLAGAITTRVNDPSATIVGWSSAFAVCTVIFAILGAVHSKILPVLDESKSNATDDGRAAKDFLRSFPVIFKDFWNQTRIWVIILYVLIFRLGDALLMKMAQPFLIDPVVKGGLGLSISDVGFIYGVVGTFFLLAGGVVGSTLIAKHGLERYILPFAIIQNLSLLLYWFLAIHKPDLVSVGCVNAFEQFSYGLGTSSYTVLLMSTVKPGYKASQYAIVTAFMALGVMLPGFVSGYLSEKLGYANFFLFSFFVSLPGIITILYLPLKQLAARRAEA